MRVHIDQEKCCGAGSCVLSAPEVFDQREEDGIVVLLDAEPPAGLHDAVHEAVAICPAAAISVEQADRAGRA
ncbi:ferredoxin [Streptomyces sp. NPDC047049]|uniref:ferredoxin n=1 Tax=Streptomyces sp. NPDC047049 TaxID=3156688 RepID=UPI0033EEAA9F